jgi:hypothetical protein
MKVLFLLFIFSSCTSLKSIDKPVCVEINMSKGYCTTIISGKDQIIDDVNLLDGKTWFEARIEMVLVPIETWASLKKYLIMNCKKTKSCNDNIDSWNRAIQSVDDQILLKTRPVEDVKHLEQGGASLLN